MSRYLGISLIDILGYPGVPYIDIYILVYPEMEFKEFEPRFKSAKTRFNVSAGLNLETFDTILRGTNHI